MPRGGPDGAPGGNPSGPIPWAGGLGGPPIIPGGPAIPGGPEIPGEPPPPGREGGILPPGGGPPGPGGPPGGGPIPCCGIGIGTIGGAGSTGTTICGPLRCVYICVTIHVIILFPTKE